MKVLVTHPGRQHSHQAAVALERAGILGGYWAGVPAVAEQAERVPGALRKRFARYPPVPIAPLRARWFPWTPAMRRVSERLLSPAGAAHTDFLACRLFDRWAALRLPSSGVDAVIACEISALATFQAARQLGIVTILDAPSLHYRAQDRLHGTNDSLNLHRKITQVKENEIALADHVLTVSELARGSYVEAGVAKDRVHAVTLGTDLELFAPSPEPLSRADGEFVFLFAGASIYRKGFDVLLAAFERVVALEAAQLLVVGPAGDCAHLIPPAAPRISAIGSVTQLELARHFQKADCLVLPSRNDSYGMVVAEALASGLPVLISNMVGSKDLVMQGSNGWIVGADDVSALSEQMLWCVRNRQTVRGMREQCRSSVGTASWLDYYRRLPELIRSIVPAVSAA